jgi:hypothetical protein
MTARSVIIDTTTGVILRTVSGDPGMFSLQVQAGESLFALTDDDGSFVDDANVQIGEAGEWEFRAGAPGTASLPGSSLELIAV